MTIKDIARLSGCAVSTVSRALNDHPDVSEETKARIKQIVAENKFVPNANAKHLKQQVSNNIIVVVKGTFNLFFAVIIERIQADVGRAGYGVVLHYYDEDINEVRMAERLCRESKPKGLIFLGGEPENFTRYFGGIKLGTSGLIVAYRQAASEAIQAATIIEKTIDEEVSFFFEYPFMNSVMRIVKEEEPMLVSQGYDHDCSMTLRIRRSRMPRLKERLSKVETLRFQED